MANDPNKQQVTALPPFHGVRVIMDPLTVTADLQPMCQAVSGVPAPPYYLPEINSVLFQYFAPFFVVACSKLMSGQWVCSMSGLASIGFADTWDGPFSDDPSGTYTRHQTCTVPATIDVLRV